MDYENDWQLIEDEYDSKNPITEEGAIQPSLSRLSLSDVLIFRNWIDYAKGIGDSSTKLLDQDEVSSVNIYRTAKTRLNTHFWRQST